MRFTTLRELRLQVLFLLFLFSLVISIAVLLSLNPCNNWLGLVHPSQRVVSLCKVLKGVQ